MMEKTERLFLGLHVSPFFAKEIEGFVNPIKEKFPEQRWVVHENMHITIHFFGSTPISQKPLIADIARETVRKIPKPEIALENIGFFPSIKKPKVCWIGVRPQDKLLLHSLYQNLTEKLKAEGFKVEHDSFTPHVTLFRTNKETPFPFDKNSPPPFETSIEALIPSLHLFKSTLKPNGADYVPQESFPFAADL